MIQRIQTLYLLGIVLLWGILPFCLLSTFSTPMEELTFCSMGIYHSIPERVLIYPTLELIIIEVLIALIAGVSIFFFKKRMMQLRMSIFNGCLMVGFYLLFFFLVWMECRALGAEWHISFPLCFPIVAFILNYLAIRGIASDEALVRSLDRIR
ncbi:MAG TPA: DUF4293 domain-containing protein [Porphyromonadaceae bacterium]|nr:DUF4293 domain-containing protein [Porphyromonadaceae bacterium]